jgi:hypothetical protein
MGTMSDGYGGGKRGQERSEPYRTCGILLIYLSTAIGFTPGGGGTVHTINT